MLPPDYSDTNIKAEEQSLKPEDAFEPAFDCDNKTRGEFDGLMEADIIDDPSYQYDDDLDQERNAEFTLSESTLTLCPICSTLFDEEDDVCIEHSPNDVHLPQ
jgi:hypothetical protein